MNIRSYDFQILPFLVLSLFVACSTKSGPSKPAPKGSELEATFEWSVKTESRSGPEIVSFVASNWAAKTAPAATSEQRNEALIFLRDRVIEAALCSGFDVGLAIRDGSVFTDHIALRAAGGQIFKVQIADSHVNFTDPVALEWRVFPASKSWIDYLPFTSTLNCH